LTGVTRDEWVISNPVTATLATDATLLTTGL
jgi:hypothetical protein